RHSVAQLVLDSDSKAGTDRRDAEKGGIGGEPCEAVAGLHVQRRQAARARKASARPGAGKGFRARTGLGGAHAPAREEAAGPARARRAASRRDRKSTRLNSSHVKISYAVFCLKKKKKHVTHR